METIITDTQTLIASIVTDLEAAWNKLQDLGATIQDQDNDALTEADQLLSRLAHTLDQATNEAKRTADQVETSIRQAIANEFDNELKAKAEAAAAEIRELKAHYQASQPEADAEELLDLVLMASQLVDGPYNDEADPGVQVAEDLSEVCAWGHPEGTTPNADGDMPFPYAQRVTV